MKIMQVIDSGGMYGAEAVVLSLVEGLRARGFDSELVSTGVPGTEGKPIELEARKRGLPVLHQTVRRGPAGVLDAVRLARTIRSRRTDIIHTHGYKATVLLGGLPMRLRGLPIVATVHGQIPGPPLSRQRLYSELERLVLRRVDRVVAVSRDMVERWSFSQAYGEKLRIIHNGVGELDSLPAGNEGEVGRSHEAILEFISSAFPLLAVGRLSPEKGYDAAIRVLDRVRRDIPAARLVIAGEGPERDKLESLVSRLRLQDHVMFAGFVREVPRLMPRFRAMLITSHTEGIPIVLLEALTAGMPVISMAVGGVPEILVDNAGLLVPAGDEAGMADAVLRLSKESGLADEIVARGLRRAAELTSSRMVDSYVRVYEELATPSPHLRSSS